MSRKNKIVRNIIIIIALLTLIILKLNFYINPLSANKDLEKNKHYGPSKIVAEYNLPEAKYYLGSYNNYISLSVIKKFGPFYRPSHMFYGYVNNKTNDIYYAYGIADNDSYLFGAINNKDIHSVQVIAKSGESFVANDIQGNMFLIFWKGMYTDDLKTIIGFNKDNKVIYKKTIDE